LCCFEYFEEKVDVSNLFIELSVTEDRTGTGVLLFCSGHKNLHVKYVKIL
jgi:hypothetical protein